MTWRSATLGDVAHWSSGGTPQSRNSAYYGGTIPWAVIGDLNDAVVSETGAMITDAGLANSAAKVVPAGTLLVAMYGSIGKLGIAGRAMATNQAIATAQVKEELDPKFLFYYLLNQRSALGKAGKGATQRNISQSILKSWPFRYPDSLDEQARIVAILEDHLSRLDAASRGLASAERRLAAFDRASLDRHFGLSGRGVSLDELVADITAGRSFGAASAPAAAGEWGIIKVSAMTWGEFKPEENKAVAADRVDDRYEIRAGDLLVSRANTAAYVGASVLVSDVRPKLLLSDKSLRLTPREGVDPRWLWRALQAPSARRQISALATGTKESMRNISQSSLRVVEVPRASSTEQATALESYETFTYAAAAARQVVAAQRSRSSALRQALLAAAFSGGVSGGVIGGASAVEEMIGG